MTVWNREIAAGIDSKISKTNLTDSITAEMIAAMMAVVTGVMMIAAMMIVVTGVMQIVAMMAVATGVMIIVAMMAVAMGVIMIVMMTMTMKAMKMLILKGSQYSYKYCNGCLTNSV